MALQIPKKGSASNGQLVPMTTRSTAVRGDVLGRLGRHEEAAALFLQAAELTANIAEQRFLRDRASVCVHRRAGELRPEEIDSCQRCD